MAIGFEPFVNEIKKNEFSATEFDTTHDEVPEEPNLEQVKLDEYERLKQEAKTKGYEEGLQQAQVEVDAKLSELNKWIEIIQKPVQLIDDKLTQEIIQTMIWICTHCIGVELTASPDKLYPLLEEIKAELPSLKGNNLFSMHPDDISWAKNELTGKLLPELDKILVADANLSRGDFYLKGENSELDGRLHNRIVTLFAKYIDKDMLITPILSQE